MCLRSQGCLAFFWPHTSGHYFSQQNSQFYSGRRVLAKFPGVNLLLYNNFEWLAYCLSIDMLIVHSEHVERKLCVRTNSCTPVTCWRSKCLAPSSKAYNFLSSHPISSFLQDQDTLFYCLHDVCCFLAQIYFVKTMTSLAESLTWSRNTIFSASTTRDSVCNLAQLLRWCVYSNKHVLQHRECKRTAPRRGWITINTEGKKTSLNNFGCRTHKHVCKWVCD